MPTTSRRDSCRASFIRLCCNFDMKICGCLALFFFRNTTLKLRQIFICTWQKERGEVESIGMYVISMVWPPCVPYPSLGRHFLRLKSLHVQFSTDIQRYFVYVYVFLQLFLLFYLFAHFFLLCMPRVSETNSQHNFICRDFAYIWFWMFASSRSSSENISPRGGLQNICAGQRDGCQLASSCCCCCCCSCRCVLLMKLCALIPHVTATQPRDRE